MGFPAMRIREFGEYRKLARVDEIGRRCLANNGFDGILTIIGVLMGSYVAGIREPRIVLSTGLATCMAMGISGFWGAYMAESAERKHALRELELAMLTDLGDTKQARASRFAVVVISLIDGLSPLVAGMAGLIPFLFAHLFTDIRYVFLAALGLSLVGLFGLGVFLARVAREKVIPAGMRMIVAGLVCVGLSFLINTKG